MKKYLLLLTIPFVIFSCKKQKETTPEEPEIVVEPPAPGIDTAVIGPYFPAYPKSIWYYVNSKKDTIIHKTDSAYTFLPANWTKEIYDPSPSDPVDAKPCYVTYYDAHPVKGYRLHSGRISQYTAGWALLLPDNIYKGNYYASEYIVSSTWFYRNIDAVDTSIVVNNVKYDSVLAVRTIHGYDKSNVSRTYYAKHIGIIRLDLLFRDSITDSQLLISYKIGKK
jgi:hypothetical protein